MRTAAEPPKERCQRVYEEFLKYIDQQLAKVKQQINELMQQSEELSAARKLLMSVPGVGPVTANILLIRLLRYAS
jgi:transposase